MVKFCTKCGNELDEKAVVCPKCGNGVENISKSSVEKKSNGMAIAGFVLSFFFALLGLIFSIVGLNKSKETKSGKGLSIAGIIISSVSMVLSFLIIILASLYTVSEINSYKTSVIEESRKHIQDESENNIELPVKLKGIKGLNEISYSEYIEKINSKEPFLVVILRDGCSYCEMYEPILKEVAEECSIPINYININHLTDKEYNDLVDSNSYLRNNQWGTPTTLFMYGTTVVDSIGGYVEKDTLIEFVKENFSV